MVINSLFPVFSLLALGVFLKRFHFTEELFLKTSDRLVYYIFFPTLLFWKIGGSKPISGSSLDYCIIAVCAVLLMALLSFFCIKTFKISSFQAGSFSQSCYRFNTYVGMAVVVNAVGVDGIRHFGILISILIPIINVVAVSSLIWFAGKRLSPRQQAAMMFKSMLSNPLILGCVAGLFYSRIIGTFPLFFENTFSLLTALTLPLALLSIGGTLTLKGAVSHFKISFLASILKLILLPLFGYILLRHFGVADLPFRVSMIFFALPTATSTYVLSSQLNSDVDLASSSIVLSTILSFVSLTVVLLI